MLLMLKVAIFTAPWYRGALHRTCEWKPSGSPMARRFRPTAVSSPRGLVGRGPARMICHLLMTTNPMAFSPCVQSPHLGMLALESVRALLEFARMQLTEPSPAHARSDGHAV